MSLHSEDVFDTGTEAQWISLSDLMTGLIMVFLLIAIAYMIKVESSVQKNQDIATNYTKLQQVATDYQHLQQVAVNYEAAKQELYSDLVKNFGSSLPAWGAEIDKDLTVRFNEPQLQFDTGKAELKPRFKQILAEFFPRYLSIITSPKYKNLIQEVRIEGHTSSQWVGAASPEDAYYKNMELSQARTRSALRYIMGLPGVQQAADWLRGHMTANGLSSSHLIRNPDGTENPVLSQRVEFHIRTNADDKLAAISGTAPATQPATAQAPQAQAVQPAH